MDFYPIYEDGYYYGYDERQMDMTEMLAELNSDIGICMGIFI